MYVKIVPSPAITEIQYPAQILECERVAYRVAVGSVEEVAGEVYEHLYHPADDGVESLAPLFWCREIVEPKDSWIAAVLLTLHQDGKPVRLVAAYECGVYVMNDKGVTVDKINAIRKMHPPAADTPVRGSSEERKLASLAEALKDSVQPQSSGTGKMRVAAGVRFRGESKPLPPPPPPPPPIVIIGEGEVGPQLGQRQ